MFYGLVGLIAFWGSFGPKAGLYTVLYHTIPVFTFLRAPGRFGILVVLALGVLALVALQTWLEHRPARTRLVAGVAGGAAAGRRVRHRADPARRRRAHA